jgi:hypothetical protein
MPIQKYPIGLQDFSEVIGRECVYVDKTKLVYDVVTRYKYNFLSRPRRFGKSLFLSTIHYLYQGKKELFKGLYIEDKWNFEEYPVIKISFSNIYYNVGLLENSLIQELLRIANTYEIKLNPREEIKTLFRDLIIGLNQQFQRKVVILIDEYDKPLIDFLDKENIHKAIENRAILKTFYSVLKDADPYLQLVFITGVSKFSQVSIFSDLNNLFDLTIQKDFNEICGLTQVELEKYFPEELKVYNKEDIKNWYNGYRWNADGTTLYNPFSILNFFAGHGEFRNYWYSTGTPTFLLKKSREERFYQLEMLTFDFDELQSFDIEKLQTIPILFQTGYLTIKEKDDISGNVVLDFRNKEVRLSYYRGLADQYIQSSCYSSSTILSQLIKSIKNENQEDFKNALNLAFAQIPYDLWQKENEHFYHAIVHLLFSLLGLHIQSEVHTKNGRADILIFYEAKIFCLEFKLDKSAEEAIQQIKSRGYLEQYQSSEKQLQLIGVNFSSSEKKVDKVIWETI